MQGVGFRYTVKSVAAGSDPIVAIDIDLKYAHVLFYGDGLNLFRLIVSLEIGALVHAEFEAGFGLCHGEVAPFAAHDYQTGFFSGQFRLELYFGIDGEGRGGELLKQKVGDAPEVAALGQVSDGKKAQRTGRL